jgi:hypothetical protein
VPATRIVLVDLGPELTSLLRTVTARTRDLMVVGEETEEVQLLLHAARADLVIIGRAGEPAAAMAERLIDENPAVAVVAVDPTVGRGPDLPPAALRRGRHPRQRRRPGRTGPPDPVGD